MKCTYCGAPVEKGRIFCMKCGEEILWVPEYNLINTYRSNNDTTTSTEEDADKMVKESTPEPKVNPTDEKDKKKKSPFRIGIVLMILCLVVLFAIKYFMDEKNYNSVDYQLNMAETDYSNHAYESAYEYVDRAIRLDQQNVEAALLKAQILQALDKTNEAVAVLLDLIENNPDNSNAYGHLIRIYEKQGEQGKIKELLADCQEESILTRFDDYVVEKPVFSLPSGEYQELIEVGIFSTNGEGSELYYTLDGSTPDSSSQHYTENIEIPEGTTEIKAIAINSKGIISDYIEGSYEVVLLPPDPPKISPTAGDFTKEMDTKIYVIVPSECIAYYAFDEEPTTQSTEYTGPVEMPEGEHTFNAILIDSFGKQSEPGSTTYNLSEE